MAGAARSSQRHGAASVAANLGALLLCVLLAAPLAAAQGAFPAKNNFPYGTGTTDTNIFGAAGSDDGMSAAFLLSKPFQFFNTSFASYSVCVNGAHSPALAPTFRCQ